MRANNGKESTICRYLRTPLNALRKLVVAQKWTITIVSLLVAVLALLVAVLAGRTEIATWSGYDWLRPEAAEEDVRILVASLTGDSSGRYIAELEGALRDAKQRFRRLGRPWNPTEEERLNVELERKSITSLLRRHNSAILVHGYVGMDGATVMLVPADVNEQMRRYLISSKDELLALTDDIEPILVNEVQARIERDKWTIGQSDRHALLDSQIEDLLKQTQSEKTRREVLFQSAFTKDKLGFWRNDTALAEESAKIYEELLSGANDPQEELLIRINLGLYYQTHGQRRASEEEILKSTEHFSKAEEIAEKIPDVRRWVKVRNLQSTNDIWLFHIGGSIDYLRSAIKRQLETSADAVGWLSKGEVLLVEQEMVGAELLLAYVTKDRNSLHYYFNILQKNREQWYAWAEEAGTRNSPWVQALIECTAVQLIDPRDLERELKTEIDAEESVKYDVSISWSSEDIRRRRQLIESWLPESKNGPYTKTYSLQLSRLADVVREEALRTHNIELLSRSFDLTQQFRVLEEVESETIPYEMLDLSHPSSEMVFRIESTFALACADQNGIRHLHNLLERGASACAAENDLCVSEVRWIGELVGVLEYGLQRWNADYGDQSTQTERAEVQRHAREGLWSEPETHALWLRWQLHDLPPSGQSYCPSRVPWVE